MNIETKAKSLKRLLTKAASQHCGKIGIPLSSGVDSHCMLFAALEAGHKPTLFSFTLDDRESRDFLRAKSTAKEYALKFVPVKLPTDVNVLINDALLLCGLGCKSKTDYECFWPMTYLIRTMSKYNIDTYFAGDGADSLYCLSRKANQHYKDREDEFRRAAFANARAFQKTLKGQYAKDHNMQYCPLFCNPAVFNLFLGTKSSEINKPKQKILSRLAFAKEFERVQIFNHTNLQLGDSGISKHWEKLLQTKLNGRQYKSVRGIYNHLPFLINATKML